MESELMVLKQLAFMVWFIEVIRGQTITVWPLTFYLYCKESYLWNGGKPLKTGF
jgi:hypothetical protein